MLPSQWTGSGRPGSAGEPVAFPAGAGPDRGHACVPAPPLNTAAGSVKATTCTLTSVTVSPALVSPSALEAGSNKGQIVNVLFKLPVLY